MNRNAIIAQLLLHNVWRNEPDADLPIRVPNKTMAAYLERQGYARCDGHRFGDTARQDWRVTAEGLRAGKAAEQAWDAAVKGVQPDVLVPVFNALSRQQRYELSRCAAARHGILRIDRRVAVSLDALGLVQFWDTGARTHHCVISDLGAAVVKLATYRDPVDDCTLWYEHAPEMAKLKETGYRIAAANRDNADVRRAAGRLLIAVHFGLLASARTATADIRRRAGC